MQFWSSHDPSEGKIIVKEYGKVNLTSRLRKQLET